MLKLPPGRTGRTAELTEVGGGRRRQRRRNLIDAIPAQHMPFSIQPSEVPMRMSEASALLPESQLRRSARRDRLR